MRGARPAARRAPQPPRGAANEVSVGASCDFPAPCSQHRLGPLADALEDAGANATDEASAMEWQGLSPRLVPGSSENFKITQPEDFAVAEAVLRARRKERA